MRAEVEQHALGTAERAPRGRQDRHLELECRGSGNGKLLTQRKERRLEAAVEPDPGGRLEPNETLGVRRGPSRWLLDQGGDAGLGCDKRVGDVSRRRVGEDEQIHLHLG